MTRIPAVAYLELEPDPVLIGSRCRSCSATFLLRRSACASCGADDFESPVRLSTSGVVTTATTIHRAMPGVPTPFTSGVVALDGGGYVRCTLTGTCNDPVAAVGRRAFLSTEVVGTDVAGVEAVGFTFDVEDF